MKPSEMSITHRERIAAPRMRWRKLDFITRQLSFPTLDFEPLEANHAKTQKTGLAAILIGIMVSVRALTLDEAYLLVGAT